MEPTDNLNQTEDIWKFFNLCRPNYSEISHKGQNGRICIVGGCALYHGAACFAGMAALRGGAELVYIITTPTAAIAIKNYSPNFIVAPYIDDSGQALTENSKEKMTKIIDRAQCVLIGPGLGDEIYTHTHLNFIIPYCIHTTKPLVIDADGIRLLKFNLEMFKILNKYKWCIYTPNSKEMCMIEDTIKNTYKENCTHIENCILKKGYVDEFIFKNLKILIPNKNISKRPGGIGDLLAGLLCVHMAWAYKTFSEPNNLIKNLIIPNFEFDTHNWPVSTYIFVMAYTTSTLIKLLTHKCYNEKKQGLIADDLLDQMAIFIDEFLINLQDN